MGILSNLNKEVGNTGSHTSFSYCAESPDDTAQAPNIPAAVAQATSSARAKN